jgi:hypothetical protein
MFQTPKTKRPDRSDHIWVWSSLEQRFECILCGAICHTKENPPDYPTPKEWSPVRYRPLTEEDRKICPMLSDVRDKK